MAARRLRVRIPTHHAGQLGLALRACHLADAGRAISLFDDQVLVAEGCDLSQVGDDDDLARCGKTLQTRTNLRCGLPADTSVNLVEDKRRRGLGAPQHQLQGEHDAREFTAGCTLAERARGRVRVRLEAEDNRLAAV